MSVSFITVSLFGPANAGNGQNTSPLDPHSSIVPFTNLSSIPVLTTPSPAQLSAISHDIASYQTSLQSEIQDLGLKVSSAVPTSVFPTISELNVPPLNVVASALAESGVASTAVNVAWLTGTTQGVTTQPWETYLDPSLRSAIEVEATSIYHAEQSIVSKDFQSEGSAMSKTHAKEWVLGIGFGVFLMVISCL